MFVVDSVDVVPSLRGGARESIENDETFGSAGTREEGESTYKTSKLDDFGVRTGEICDRQRHKY